MTFEVFLKNFGKNLALMRMALPMTQKNISEKLGISYRYYQRIEGGVANITLSTLFKLALFLGKHPAELLSGEAPKTQAAKIRQ